MRVRFRDNIGSIDCKEMGLNFQDCTKDAELDVDNKLGEELLKRGFAEPATAATKFKGVPSVEVKTSDSK